MARDETDRYRQAAEDALQQLDWCIGYLHGIHKTKIAAQLGRNRTFIKRELMKQATEPIPSEVTNET
jgi:DNA-binding transcriptional regulator LsrR (DeoR family)